MHALITPSGPGPRGWFGGFYQSEGTYGMTPQETIDWLRVRTRTGSLEAVVAPRPLRSAVPGQQPGDAYILSTWNNFKGFATSNVELMLRNEAGTWYWSGRSSTRRRARSGYGDTLT